jgi:hypothetical protein
MTDRFSILLAQGGSATTGVGSAGSVAAEGTSRSFTILPKFGDLVEKIKSGEIHLSDVPAFISSFIEVAIMLSGVIAFMMILVGGYQYIIGGLYSDMREQGKSTLIYAITGFVISLLAYGIVNLIQLAATGI